MKRDFVKKQFKTNYSAIMRRYGILLLGGIAVLFCCVVFFIYQHKNHLINTAGISIYFAQLKTWIAERKNRLHSNITKAKQIAMSKDDTEQQIHFEFYTTLPNMQMSVSDANGVSVSQAVESPNIQEVSVVSVKPLTAEKTDEKKSEATLGVPVSIVSAAELEQEFAKQIKQFAYVIQTGVFKHAAAAEKYRQWLAESGFSAKVIKANTKNDSYRVQLGPYANKEQAKTIQQQLQKKGINGLIRRA